MTFLFTHWKLLGLTALFVLLGVQTMRIAGLERDIAERRAVDAEAQQLAERAERAKETRWRGVVDKEVNDEKVRTAQARADARAANTAADELRDARDYAFRQVRQLTAAATASEAKRAQHAARMLAFVQGRIDARAGLLAGVADERGAAGGMCERIADGLQQMNH